MHSTDREISPKLNDTSLGQQELRVKGRGGWNFFI